MVEGQKSSDKGKGPDIGDGPREDNGPEASQPNSTILDNIRSSLRRKDDTSRFVGLTMLRAFLDSSSELRSDPDILLSLWEAISPKFLDRLIKSKNVQGQGDKSTYPTLDLGVLVIHRFTLLLPEQAKRSDGLVGRIPTLVDAVLRSSEETTQRIVQTLLELVTFHEGSAALISVSDLSPLVEVAPSQRLVLSIFDRAWLNCMAAGHGKTPLTGSIDQTIQGLVSAFKGTDGVTFLQFLGDFLRKSQPEALPPHPRWIQSVVQLVRNLLTSRPNPAARNAYTLVSASLLEVYPADASRLLFTTDVKDDKPFAYLLITLILTDIRATIPRLLSLLNDPSYPDTAKQIGSAFDIVTHFVGYLVRSIDALVNEDTENEDMSIMLPAEFLLKIRTNITETMSLTIEFLRDRWDASVAGAMGLHPDARPGAAEHWKGYLPISWESTRDVVDNDPLILAAIRALALWLREDDNKQLRKESAGLTDLFLDLYESSSSSSSSSSDSNNNDNSITADRLDFRSAVLVALEGVMVEEKGIHAFIKNEGWKILSKDLFSILQAVSTATASASASASAADHLRRDSEAVRGREIVRVLLAFVESEEHGTEEDWMGVITAVAAWSPPDDASLPLVVQEFLAAVLQLATALLANAHDGVRKRYAYSTSAIVGIATQLQEGLDGEEGREAGDGGALRESLDDVFATLGSLD
ncbi:DUF1941-domain-containing protein [Sodiomyces alkalinus F11]|uniref:DUF1941-domain-containing protein n=1 Tax=Sodiomyces alkalinus (strain CBS 110278 / VKM F-3762 / F11) TaxID=1314773 RepID=A0A3N2Q0P6_SODAK|nr:DUF1941-domain-containing protein [Sodiomyces alkalinus F11]ROT40331.1 DUF1941-domain-containing protein [Sodiomyces alkalinus F11]